MKNSRQKISYLPVASKAGFIATIFCCVLLYFGPLHPLQLFNSLDNKILDTMFGLRGPLSSSGSVIIIDIDERSLEEYGQWPWPRSVVTELTEKILKADPLVVGFDLTFTQKERFTTPLLGEQFQALIQTLPSTEREELEKWSGTFINSDRDLGRTFQDPRIVQGYRFLFQEDFQKRTGRMPNLTRQLQLTNPQNSFEQAQLISAYRVVLNSDAIRGEGAEGFLNLFHDRQGTVRNSPLFLLMDNQPYPSLTVEMILRSSLENQPQLSLAKEYNSSGYLPVESIAAGSHRYVTDPFGQVTINFRGPSYTFLYLSAADILQGNFDSLLTGKYVLIGSTASGKVDLLATPYSTRMPGVEVHANILDNLIKKDNLVRDETLQYVVSYGMLLSGGLILSLSLVLLPALVSILLCSLILLTIGVANYYLLFLNNILFDVSLPLLLLAVIALTTSLCNYIFEGKKRSFIKHAFTHYVSPGVVNELTRHPEKLDLLVDTREVTVLFCDIRDFTTLAEKASPEELSSFLNSYFSLLTEIIMQHNGMVDKYIGDAIMAVWGTPLENSDHASQAVKAAMKMVEAVKENSHELMLSGEAISIGVGINSGMVSAGNFGCSKRFDYTVLGDNVNLASRLESITKFYPASILVSESTKAQAQSIAGYRYIDTVLVKGRKAPVILYEPRRKTKDARGEDEESRLYMNGIALYRCGDFKAAAELFDELGKRADDPVYTLYLKRCQQYQFEPPGESWSGIHDFS